MTSRDKEKDDNYRDGRIRNFIDWLRNQGAVIIKLDGVGEITFAAPKAMPYDPAEEKLAREAREKLSAEEMYARQRFGAIPDDFPRINSGAL